MNWRISGTDGTMGATATGTATFKGHATGVSNAFSDGALVGFLKSHLTGNGFGVKSVSASRRRGTTTVDFTVVFIWDCQDVNGILAPLKNNVAAAFLADGVYAHFVSKTGCSISTPKPPTGGSTPTNDKPDKPEQTWEEWFKENQTPVLIGGLALVLLMRRR